METAKAISDFRFPIPDSFIFRAGVWKPRTSPYTFQGVGEEGLAWLQEVKDRYGVPVATEVATPEHVEKALAAGIDYLWIGARSSANPIAVQEIANAIDRFAVRPASPVSILIKNPVNADAALWLGNIERLEKTGVPVIAVHRGCNHQPCWKMAHEVRLARPDIPMLLDPSHMSGDAAQVSTLMGKIEELGLNGAMIEVHCDPEHALSDKKQQITPAYLIDTLGPILSRLCLASLICAPTVLNHRARHSRSASAPRTPSLSKPKVNWPLHTSLICPSDGQKELNWLRAEIDELDERLWDTIAARMDVSRRIGEWKKAHGVAPLQPERYQEKSEELRAKSEELGLAQDFVKHIWDLIHEESLKQQE